jgi:hypothetical protein
MIFLNLIKTYRVVFLTCAFIFSALTPVCAADGRDKINKETCVTCHQFNMDVNHQNGCSTCHAGNPESSDRDKAHAGLNHRPSDPDNMLQICGPCHAPQTKQFHSSDHLTLKNMVNTIRISFGADSELNSLTEIPVHDTPATPLELADDMLRRRCLRCHLYYEGDSYPSTGHGTGCAACHLRFADNSLQSHTFVKLPDDDMCLSCHYGNTVGADYYGRYEQDYNWEYRTPFVWFADEKRPYGVETHQLTPDIHQQMGLSCIDCHIGADHDGTGVHNGSFQTVSCKACHQAAATSPDSLPHITMKESVVTLTGRLNGKKYRVSQLQHPAHFDSSIKADCVVCHAQWSFNDKGTHLLRLDGMNPETWTSLSVQGSSEVEDQVENEEDIPFMADKISGEAKPGLWLKGYEKRRWETVPVGSDKGVLKVFRPIMDIHLSFRDSAGNVIVDSAGINRDKMGYRPYTPHTVGKAGIFYRQRLLNQLPVGSDQQAVGRKDIRNREPRINTDVH